MNKLHFLGSNSQIRSSNKQKVRTQNNQMNVQNDTRFSSIKEQDNELTFFPNLLNRASAYFSKKQYIRVPTVQSRAIFNQYLIENTISHSTEEYSSLPNTSISVIISTHRDSKKEVQHVAGVRRYSLLRKILNRAHWSENYGQSRLKLNYHEKNFPRALWCL